MRTHFKGIDSLRALAAITVVIGHVELLKSRNGIADFETILPDGHLGVILFFVISGFLITYLLMEENKAFGNINVKQFYMRRILRIWPLYYLTLLLSWSFFPGEFTTTGSILTLTIFPNVAQAIGEGWPTSPQVWSIGVEEQFYLIWPILLIYIRRKWIPVLLLIFVLIYDLTPHAINYIEHNIGGNKTTYIQIQKFIFDSKFSAIALGAMMGFLVSSKHKILDFFQSKRFGYLSILFPLILWGINAKWAYFTDEIYMILFALLVLSVATNPFIKLPKEPKITIFLGKISYGIYMFHWMVILLALQMITPETFKTVLHFNIVLYSFILATTITIAWISHITVERFFINKKKHFRREKVQT
ncbi:MAG: acyltransferase [Crocinitomicaceae bacterium]|nr:acyltransferase [Crocinitomicaceae bacterium]